MRNKELTLPASARSGSALTTAFVAAALTYSWWHEVSPWLGFTIALVAGTAADMIWAARKIVPLPHIALLIASLQYGLAPWASNFYPSLYSEYQINDLPEYFNYAGPVLAAMTLGFVLSGIGMRLKQPDSERPHVNPGLLRELDFLLWGGVAVSVLFGNKTGSLAFVFVLLGCLRYIGAIGWMIVAAPGWKWRVGFLVMFEIYTASSSGMFHDLILWSLSLLAIYVFLRHVKRLVFVSALVGLVAAIFFLQDAKWTLRDAIWNENNEIVLFGKPRTFSPWTRPFVSAFCLIDSCTKFFTGGYSEESIANSVTRFNQGWIIDRVMHHVPEEEPYARGETIWGALEAAALPRVLDPGKLIVNGRVNMQRFAGHDMVGDTTMNIGFAGEMYANFGLWGGVFGCGCYALMLGLFFRWAAFLAQKSAFWWAIAVYCGHWGFKAETDIGGVLNYVVKSVMLVFAVTLLMPAMRNELLGKWAKTSTSTDDSKSARRRIRGRKSGFAESRPALEPIPATVSVPQRGIDPISGQIKNADA